MGSDDIYQKLAEKIFMGSSELIPKIFAAIANQEEAELLLALPGTVESLSQALGKDREKLEEMLGVLYRKGLVFKKSTPEGILYRMCRDLMQFHDATILWPEAPRKFLDLWQEFMEKEWPAFSEMAEKVLPRPVTRIVPVSESIDARQQILAFDDVRRMIEEAGDIAVTNCTCRLTARKCDRPVEICIQIGKAAQYTIDRGTGRRIDREEALALVKKAEEVGLIHTTMNRAGDTHFICNCCEDCCMIFPVLINRKLKMCDPSRFVASIDPELCQGCETCLERCYFGALSLNNETNVMEVNAEACMGCGLCKVVCENQAISLVEHRPADFIPQA